MKTIIDNWKTSIAGIVVIALCASFLMKGITLEQFLGAVAIATGGGLLAARDGKFPPPQDPPKS